MNTLNSVAGKIEKYCPINLGPGCNPVQAIGGRKVYSCVLRCFKFLYSWLGEDKIDLPPRSHGGTDGSRTSGRDVRGEKKGINAAAMFSRMIPTRSRCILNLSLVFFKLFSSFLRPWRHPTTLVCSSWFFVNRKN